MTEKQMMEYGLEACARVAKEHGIEALSKTLEVIKTIASAVRAKYGECNEIMYAVEIMHDVLVKIKENVNKEETIK